MSAVGILDAILKPHKVAMYRPILLCDLCSYCGRRAEAVDHIEPTAKGGANVWDNLTATCRSCNSRKQARSLLDFLRRGGAMQATTQRAGDEFSVWMMAELLALVDKARGEVSREEFTRIAVIEWLGEYGYLDPPGMPNLRLEVTRRTGRKVHGAPFLHEGIVRETRDDLSTLLEVLIEHRCSKAPDSVRGTRPAKAKP